jgi:hypothetical protein
MQAVMEEYMRRFAALKRDNPSLTDEEVQALMKDFWKL